MVFYGTNITKIKDKKRVGLFKSWLDFLTFSLILGVLLLSLGVYLVGINFPNGNIVLTIGSLIVYITTIILAFKI